MFDNKLASVSSKCVRSKHRAQGTNNKTTLFNDYDT